ncbi:MAG TPA: nucleoside-diphosphate sugar epimerase/dehydratase, partial [Sumerlaeia bacterium]|nr:nucleoside-diphosphate sugar epimerase/dehydratase [Sumerlaeia bacterium]
AALLLAYALRFLPPYLIPGETIQEAYRLYFHQALLVLPALVVLRLLFLVILGVYRGISRFAGLHELRQILLAVSYGTLALAGWDLFASFVQGSDRFQGLPEALRWRVPIAVVAVDWMACLILVGGARGARRMRDLTRFNSSAAIHNVVIIGAGEVGDLVVRNFMHNPQMGYRPLGYVDEDQSLWGRQIHGLPVFGGLEDLPNLIEEMEVVEVLVATPQPSLRLLNRIVEICEAAHVGFKIVPAVSDLMSERMSINQIRSVGIEDLLGREPVDLKLGSGLDYLRDETVMVTGAGGSIGSELCRQILQGHPRQLLLVGRGENSLYEIVAELRMKRLEERLTLLIADIQDVERMERIFEERRPTIVFHAAAHKHVPLMESHPGEAIKNNIIGTFNVAFLSKQGGAKRFILISTDKAVEPASVMGASKRVAEMIVSAFSRDSDTSFISVRFGNVLGSRGSVAPLFRKQIAAGGPVTVTHPEVERYFMTIPEAAHLVLQAGAMGGNGQLLLLDMGRPVKIVDLARRMITLSGFEPNVDVDIEFIGLRPGEKLKEELLTPNEDLSPTEHPKIFATRVDKPTLEEVKEWLRRLDALIDHATREEIIAELQGIVPEFQPFEGEASG